ncbi:PepSY-associated TM helix domain-containing protein [Sediminibacterium ginsengisoli]|nr:PepSY-associated TM helix domain-containing protein [Sediminibacterium ginsengisoli]
MSPWKRRLSTLSRWLHIYLSMISFVILLFFAVTGLTLNHPEWGNKVNTTQQKGKLNVQWVNNEDTSRIAKLEVVEFLRKTHHIKGAMNEFRIDDMQCSVSFKGPGYASDIFITRETGEYELSETRTGFIGIINDLHKGRDSGSAWSAVIDFSAILMTIVSLSGLVLMCFLKKKRTAGLAIAVLGLIISLFFYFVATA